MFLWELHIDSMKRYSMYNWHTLSSASSASGGAEWVVEGVAKGKQLGSPERIREKIQAKTAMLVSSELASERENVKKAESKITELEEKVESAETRVRIVLARAVSAEIQCDRMPRLEQKLQSTEELAYTKQEELKAITTQFRATRKRLAHIQEQFSTQQRVLSHLQYTAQQTQEQLQARVQSTQQLLHTREDELKDITTQCRATQGTLLHTQEQLQARVRENAALYTHNQALENQVGTLQNQRAQLEQTAQATQAALGQIPYLEQQLKIKEAQLQSLTQVTQIPVQPTTASVCEAGLQTGAVGALHPAELQQRITYLEEKISKEAFLANVRSHEVDALQEDVMERLQVEFHDTSTQTMVDDICIPGTSPTGKQQHALI